MRQDTVLPTPLWIANKKQQQLDASDGGPLAALTTTAFCVGFLTLTYVNQEIEQDPFRHPAKAVLGQLS